MSIVHMLYYIYSNIHAGGVGKHIFNRMWGSIMYYDLQHQYYHRGDFGGMQLCTRVSIIQILSIHQLTTHYMYNIIITIYHIEKSVMVEKFDE